MVKSHLTGTSHPDHRRGLRTVAMIEALKGVLAVAAGFALAEFIRHDVDLENAAHKLLVGLRIDPDLRISHYFLRTVERVSDTNLWNVVAIIALYASLRFLESYGLWRQRIWGEWLAIVSGAIYLPFELRALIRHPTPIHWAVLLINIVIVVYIAYVRWEDIQQRHGRTPTGGLVEDGD